MKLYTQEQIKLIGDWASQWDLYELDKENNSKPPIFKSFIEELTPIELPSDVEVGKIVLGNSPIMEHRDSGFFALGAMEYNKWLKEQILKQNRLTINETKRSIEGIGLNNQNK